MKVKVGSYTGDGVDGKTITATGINPDFVLIKGGANRAVMTTSTLGADESVEVYNVSPAGIEANLIQSLGTAQFTVGTDARVNTNGTTYYWFALEDDSADDIAFGTYAGTGSNVATTGLGFSPDMIIWIPEAADFPRLHAPASPSNRGQTFEGAETGSILVSLDADGFTSGSVVSTAATTYHYIALKQVVDVFSATSYSGNDTDNRSITGAGFEPDFAIVKSKASIGLQAAIRFAANVGDSSAIISATAFTTDHIQDFEADGIQVGTSNNVNFSVGTYHAIFFQESAGTVVPVTPTLAVSGTVVPSATEQEVRDGGQTIVLTLTDATWEPSIGECNELTEALIDGLVSDQDEAHGWNVVVRGGTPYDDEVLDDTPLAYWRLDGAEDISGNAHTIDTFGSGVTQDIGSLLVGDSNPAMEFDGANAGITVDDAAALQNIFDGGGTAEAIIMPFSDGEDDNGRIVSKGNVWALAVYEQSGGLCRLYFRHEFSTTTGLWQTAQEIPLGVKTHVAVTYDNSAEANDPTLYINSVAYTVANGRLSETSTPAGTRVSDASEDIYIGGFGTDVLRFRGRIDDVALYTSVLSADRILAHVTAAYHPVGLTCDDVVRTSDTVVTITMPAFATFDITIDETITVTAPEETHSWSADLVGSPTFDIITDGTITTEPPPDPDPGPDPGFEFPDDTLDVGFDVPFGRILRIEVAEISPTSDE